MRPRPPTAAELIDAATGPRRRSVVPSLEELLTSRELFGLTTATRLQRAVCRVADGAPLGDLANDPDVREAMGDVALDGAPAELCLLSGIRTAKSLLAAGGAIRMTQVCDVSRLGAGETARVSVVSLSLDLANVVMAHLVGHLTSRPLLSGLLLDHGADHVLVRHPSGKAVEIKVVAGARAGATLVARWSAGAIFDEAPKMLGSAEGVVNLDDMRAAVIGRLLPGATIWTIGSPWAPFGPVYRMVQESWRKPSARLVVIKAPAWRMNPVYWTSEKRAELAATDPLAYRTDCEAEFADPEEALISTPAIERCTRREPLDLPRENGAQYVAAMDPATRGNAWTLAIGTRKAGKRVVVLARQWRGTPTTPLDPSTVLLEIALVLRAYGLDWVETDQWATDALTVIARKLISPDGRTTLPLNLVEWPATSATNADMFGEMRRCIDAGDVELPPDPFLRSDLQRLRRRTTQSGVAIVLPQTADGRHCDYAPVVARVLRRFVEDAKPAAPPDGSEEAAQAEQRRVFAKVQEHWGQGRKHVPFWKRKAG